MRAFHAAVGKSLHNEIARHLESRSTATGESEPTLIAHHYSRAGDGEKSFRFLVACRRSFRSASGVCRVSSRISVPRSRKQSASSIRRSARI